MMEFGRDGFLYIGTGDGGAGGDPYQNGQSLTNGSPQANSIALLGKMLRIDVNTKAPGKEYGIPSTNPFAAGGGAPEIFLIGLRNPWRWSFDKGTGDLWIGDVGQDQVEELTVAGWHFYTDWNSPAAGLHRARLMANDALEIVDVSLTLPASVVSIHADSRGEIYLTTQSGGLYHVEAAP